MRIVILFILSLYTFGDLKAQRKVEDFNEQWNFHLGDTLKNEKEGSGKIWQSVQLPHDWSIGLAFNEKSPATTIGGALDGGIGWYRKSFNVPISSKDKNVFIEFDGVYRNSEVWVNGHYLGKRPNGYISFKYEITKWLLYGGNQNSIVVKVDNSQQPNSRWYTGSGIYRNIRLITHPKTSIDETENFVTTPVITANHAEINVSLKLNTPINFKNGVEIISKVFDARHQQVAIKSSKQSTHQPFTSINQKLKINQPKLWSTEHPYLYTVETKLLVDGIAIDAISTTTGIRSFYFDAMKGFFFDGKPMKILGVCLHHDQGALGAAVNKAAIRRQLTILKEMGANAIRTAHNPPAKELLDLCDEMGFLVMDEAFDMWKKKKNKFDYYSDFPEWHQRDLEDQVKRDRNHPSVFMWSIGNEIREQFDSSGIILGKELVAIIKNLDTTRPVTCALSESDPKKNFIYQSGALDVIGLNYHIETYEDFPKNYPGQKFIGAENVSGLATRGHYDMPSDSMRFWPESSKFKTVEKGNPDQTVSAYDNVAAYWGSSHEDTWKKIKKYPFLSGLFVWSGFDYLGEPTPYPWPARSSYFGIVDLAGFPKDVYYMYQSEWTSKPVLHIFPHWNWTEGQLVDVWAYYNMADEVELFLNGKSLGIRRKQANDLHVMWRVPFEAGTIKAISRKNGKTILTKEIHTAAAPYQIILSTKRNIIHSGIKDLSFITVKIVDRNGNLVPNADNLIELSLEGNAELAAMDNGFQASLESFKSNQHKAYKGLCLAIIQSKSKSGMIQITVKSKGLKSAKIFLESR